jgi:hypothetical protein
MGTDKNMGVIAVGAADLRSRHMDLDARLIFVTAAG